MTGTPPNRHYQGAKYGALIAALLLIIAGAWLAPMDHAAHQQIDAGFKRALLSFASARALNAVISVAQGTEVAIQPAGLGLVLTPGQILDPFNDLVEQFANLMLLASVAFGVQKVLLTISAHWLASSLLSGFAIAWAVLYLRKVKRPTWLSRLVIIFLLLRFAIPVVTLSSDLLFREFLAADYQTSQQAIELTSSQVATLSAPTTDATNTAGSLDKLKNWFAQHTDVKAQFAQLKQAAEQAASHIISLMVIFLLQTLLMPIALLWGLYQLTRSALNSLSTGKTH